MNEFRKNLPFLTKTGVYLSNSGLALSWGRFIRETGYTQLSKNKEAYFKKYVYYKALTERKKVLRVDNPLSVHNLWTSGYHHWLAEVLVKLAVHQEKLAEYTLLLPVDYPRFAFESLKAFPLGSIKTLDIKAGYFCQEASFIGNPRSGMYNPEHLEKLKNILLSYARIQVNENTLPEAPKIYISRRQAKMRKVKNEEEVVQFLTAKGYYIMEAENYSFWDQVYLFSKCKSLISIHGAGLTNAIFMENGDEIIELIGENKNNNYNDCYFNLAEAKKLVYKRILSQITNFNPNLGTGRQDIYVNLDELSEVILGGRNS